MKVYKFDFSAKTKPFSHQVEAIEFLKTKKAVALFDEQGLGKTKIVIDALCDEMEAGLIDCALIICKKSLIATWEDEIKLHSHLNYVTLRGTEKEKGNKFMWFSHFYLINYETLISELDRIYMFVKIKRIAIVLDESQRMKNPRSKTAQSIFKIKSLAQKRIIITGTPVANKPEDIWSQFYFLDDGRLLGEDFDNFKRRFEINLRTSLKNYQKALNELKVKINTISLRRLKDQVLELPEKRYHNCYVKLSTKQNLMYEKLKKELFIEIKNISGERIIDEAENILKKLLRLIQIASNPALIDSSYNEQPAKFIRLDGLVRDIIERNEKVIIWSSFVGNIRLLRNRYKMYGALILYGEVPIDERKIIVKQFQQEKSCKILVANPGAAREGLTLTAANNAIYIDRNFSLADYLQSQDRIHRITQTKICDIIKIIAKDTIDEYVDEIIYKKHKIAQYLQGDIRDIKEDRRYLTKDEILQILG